MSMKNDVQKRTGSKIGNGCHVHLWQRESNLEVIFYVIIENSWSNVCGVSVTIQPK